MSRSAWAPPSVVHREFDRRRYAVAHGSAAGVRRAEALRNSLLPWRFPVVISTAGDGAPSIAHAGIRDGVVKQLQLLEQTRALLGGGRALRSEQRLSHDGLSGLADSPPADIVVISGSARQVLALPRDRSLVLPYRVHLVVDLTEGLETVRRRISRRERWQFSRNLRSRGWRWEECLEAEDFEEFYERFYQPTMDRRHGERARREPKRSAYSAIFRGGRLFFVRDGDRRVAGVLCHWDGKRRTMTMRLLGVCEGAEEHYESGAFAALYHFLLEWCAGQGIPRLDFAGTEAFIAKGIYQWKRKFAPTIERAPNWHAGIYVWFHVARDTPEVRDFLVANPVLAFRAQGGLEAVYFHDDLRPARTDLVWKAPGVHGERYIHLDELLTVGRSQASGSVTRTHVGKQQWHMRLRATLRND